MYHGSHTHTCMDRQLIIVGIENVMPLLARQSGAAPADVAVGHYGLLPLDPNRAIDDNGNNQGTRKNDQSISIPNRGEFGFVVCIDWQVLFLHFPMANDVQHGRACCVT
jgi:hypothetical protein